MIRPQTGMFQCAAVAVGWRINWNLLQFHFHLHVAADIVRMFDRQVAETVLLIKVDGGGALVVALQKQAETARAAGLGDAGLDEAATDAVPLRLGRDSELHKLVIILQILAAHHGKRAHGLATQQGNEDVLPMAIRPVFLKKSILSCN